MHGTQSQFIVLDQNEIRKTGFADASCARQHSIEDRLQFAGRTADDLEHIGGSRLLLKRFAQLTEQACVLDGNDGLVGEVLHQFDLLVGERAHLLPIDGDDANRRVCLDHGHSQHGPSACEIKDGVPRWIGRISRLRSNVGNLDWLPRPHSAVHGNTCASANYRFTPPHFGVCSRCPMQGNTAERIAFQQKQHAELGPADAHGIGKHRLEHRLQLAGR
jgi:hypothetical protein